MPIHARSRLAPVACAPLMLIAAGAAAAACDELATLTLADTTIVAAGLVAPGAFEPPGGGRFGARAYAGLPEFCRIEAVAQPAAGSEIGIEVWLPTLNWNSKLVGVGNGGWAGSISHSAMAEMLAAGYASASTDTGHRGGNVDFIDEHPDKLVDFAHRAVHAMTETAKAVTAAFYGRTARRAYFSGCSTGGRQALTEAQRYPGDYDGIIAGAPAYYPSHIQGMQVYTAAVANRSPEAALSGDDFARLNSAAIAACDTDDGVADGVIENPLVCDFDPGALACPADGGDACLNPAQIETVRSTYSGPATAAGESLFPGLAPGSESGWTTLSGTAPLSLAAETYERLVHANGGWDWRDFDPAVDIPLAVERIGPLMDAADPDLTAFVDRGGKLLLYHGWSDPGIPPGGTIRYVDSVRASLGADQADDAVRLFLVPGMGHCGGGTGTDRFDAVAALDAWLETDTPPARIEAERIVDGETVRSRPLCPYPTVAVHDGAGDSDSAANFSCR